MARPLTKVDAMAKMLLELEKAASNCSWRLCPEPPEEIPRELVNSVAGGELVEPALQQLWSVLVVSGCVRTDTGRLTEAQDNAKSHFDELSAEVGCATALFVIMDSWLGMSPDEIATVLGIDGRLAIGCKRILKVEGPYALSSKISKAISDRDHYISRKKRNTYMRQR